VTFAPADPIPARKSRGPLILGTIVGVLVLLGIGAAVLQYYTNWLWFDSVNATSVFRRVVILRISLFAAFGLTMALGLWISLWLPYRLRPPMRPTPDQIALERYRQAFDPARRFVFIAVPALFGLLAGASASAEWRNWMLFLNGVPFKTTDSQFHKNVGFYIYDYPIYRTVLGFALTLLLLSTLGTVVVSYLYGGIRLQAPPGHRMYRATQVIVSIQLGLFFLVKAGNYWMDRFALELKQGSLITGLTYTDVHAVLPGRNLLTGASIIVALLFFANIFVQRWMFPIVGVASLLGISIIVGGIYPALVQRFSVTPSAATKEAPYITRNIGATRTAYALDNIKTTNNYKGVATPTPEYLKQDAGTLQNIRIMDPAVLPKTFSQLQAPYRYYAFPDSLDIDRYTLDGQLREAVVAAREVNINGLTASQQNWINTHIVFTHGFGFAAAYSNTALSSGKPKFFEGEIPPVGQLNIDQPRVYFGEQSPPYSIVGAPKGSKPVELDFPDNNKASKQQNYTYTGIGGVPLGSTLNRIAYALRLSDLNILLSSSVNSESRLLYIREPRSRVAQVAPWLTLDGDPYPTVINNRIVWIVDGYTTTNNYPGATPSVWRNSTQDSLNSAAAVAGQPQAQINYVRNSIKATVDAYDGTVTLYAWDNTSADPLLKTWEAAFPGLVKPADAMPVELRQHVRYPEDMFKVQRTIYAKYHVTNSQTFWSGGDNWTIPDDPTRTGATVAQPPYYLQLQMPDQSVPEFQLTSTFVRPGNIPSLAAFMSVGSQVGADYGQIRVLALPSNTSVPGPGQVQNQIEADTTISGQLSLWRRGGSDVVFGNMLSLPVAGGFLYVEPMFIRATTGSTYPLLGKVVATLGQTPVMANDLPSALAGVFGSPNSNPGGGGGGGGTTLTPQQQLNAALASMQSALADADAALIKQDWTAYGLAQKQLQAALDRAVTAQSRINSPAIKPTATPSPSASASGSASPSAPAKAAATPIPN
jgi:uncharacterized membrane protein (UPF0182 family)